MSKSNSIRAFLWFNEDPKLVAAHYKRIFKSDYEFITKQGGKGDSPVTAMEFQLAGNRMIAYRGDGQFQFTPAISFMVECKDQKAIDRYWERFLNEGGKPGQCGWLTDKYGVSWQIVPKNLPKLLSHKTEEGSKFLMEEFLKMSKIEINALHYKAPK
ncbi:MAG: hypothetical protein RLZZ122_203 [Actinomycetota bacterium]|jgi:predicted 3-demethylubiquinone-9 3-methyltransferase (glyoxalase superfamily)